MRTRRTSACSRSPRCATSRRCATSEGRVAALPELERILGEVLETIRGFQARRPPSRRLLWNRIQLYVWPVIELSPEEINAVHAAPGAEHARPRHRARRRPRSDARPRRHGARPRAALLHARGRGRRRRSGRALDGAAAAARRGRAPDRRCSPARRPAPCRDRAPAGAACARPRTIPPGSSSSTISTTTARSCPSIARPPPIPRASSSAPSATSPSATPRACCA